MTKKKESTKSAAASKPVKAAPKPAEEVISDEQLDKVAGGFNPQPDPPGFIARIANPLINIFRR